MIQINLDPTEVFTMDVCIRLKTVDQTVESNPFRVSVQCDNSIEIFEPPTLQYHQEMEATVTTDDWAVFSFDSFQTKTTACQVESYHLAELQTDGIIVGPMGMLDQSPYEESPTSGILNENSFLVKITDGTVPFTYEFHIFAEGWISAGEERPYLWSPASATNSENPNGDTTRLSLTVKCPPIVEVVPSAGV